MSRRPRSTFTPRGTGAHYNPRSVEPAATAIRRERRGLSPAFVLIVGTFVAWALVVALVWILASVFRLAYT
jgi:hypothetical protein